jgi:hypothetical protein
MEPFLCVLAHAIHDPGTDWQGGLELLQNRRKGKLRIVGQVLRPLQELWSQAVELYRCAKQSPLGTSNCIDES